MLCRYIKINSVARRYTEFQKNLLFYVENNPLLNKMNIQFRKNDTHILLISLNMRMYSNGILFFFFVNLLKTLNHFSNAFCVRSRKKRVVEEVIYLECVNKNENALKIRIFTYFDALKFMIHGWESGIYAKSCRVICLIFYARVFYSNDIHRLNMGERANNATDSERTEREREIKLFCDSFSNN